jgi:DNA-binding NarL/FixJ family response regulator
MRLRSDGVINQFDTARDGDEAIGYLELCVQGEYVWPCAVFIATDMTDPDGFEVLRRIRARGWAARTTIVMHARHDGASDVRRSFDGGAHAFASTNTPPSGLKHLVDSAMAMTRGKKPVGRKV